MTIPDPGLTSALERWSKITAEATPGPWEVHTSSSIGIRIMSDEDEWPLALDLKRRPDAEFMAVARTAMPALLAVAEAVLRLHQPKPLYGLAFGGLNNDQPLCSHDPDTDHDAHFEGDDGHWYCRDKITAQVCRSCADEDDADLWAEWPCPTVQAITRELTGKENGDA